MDLPLPAPERRHGPLRQSDRVSASAAMTLRLDSSTATSVRAKEDDGERPI